MGWIYGSTELEAAILLGQLEQWPGLGARRVRNAALRSGRLARIDGICPPSPQPAITREAIYNYVLRYRRHEVSRDLFVAALDREGIPCDGRFYEPVYRSDLFRVNPEDFPQLKLGRSQPVHYHDCRCPVAEHAAYEEAVWLPQFLLLWEEDDLEYIGGGVHKVITHLDQLAVAVTPL